MKRALHFSLFLFISPLVFSQHSAGHSGNNRKNEFYFSFGWHRIFYTPGTIHFKDLHTSNYDFKLLKAKGKDDHDLKIGKGHEAPQYSIRVGLFLGTNLALVSNSILIMQNIYCNRGRLCVSKGRSMAYR